MSTEREDEKAMSNSAPHRWICITDSNGIELFRRRSTDNKLHKSSTMPDSTQMALLSVIHNQFSMQHIPLQSLSTTDTNLVFYHCTVHDLTVLLGGRDMAEKDDRFAKLLMHWIGLMGVMEDPYDTDMIRRRLRWLSGAVNRFLRHGSSYDNVFLVNAYHNVMNHAIASGGSDGNTSEGCIPVDLLRRVNHTVEGCAVVINIHNGVIHMSDTWCRTVPLHEHCRLLSLAVAFSSGRSLMDIPIALRNDSMVRLVCLALGDGSTMLVRLLGQNPRNALELVDTLPSELVSYDDDMTQKLEQWSEENGLLAVLVSSKSQAWYTRWTTGDDADRALQWFVRQGDDYSRARMANGWQCVGGNMQISITKKVSVRVGCWCIFGNGAHSVSNCENSALEIGQIIYQHIMSQGTSTTTSSKKASNASPSHVHFPFIPTVQAT